jgi:hypothetical protein
MHTAKSLKAKIILYFHTPKKTAKKKKYICFIIHFDFNNQFIKVTNISKISKKIFCFVLVSGIRIYT